MNTDPTGYFSLGELNICTTISNALRMPVVRILANTAIGAMAGAAIGAVDSILGGNEGSQVLQDALSGAISGAVLGGLISALVCMGAVYPMAVLALETFQEVFLISGSIGVCISLRDGNPFQAVFRGIVTLFAYRSMGKSLERLGAGSGASGETSYGKSSGKAKAFSEYEWYENATDATQKASRGKNKIHPNPNANGNHVVYKVNPVTGKVTNYKVYEVNPSGFDEILGYDGVGKPHKNPVTGEYLMPHMHDNTVPGKVRIPNLAEIPD